jgi:hypothetical protein
MAIVRKSQTLTSPKLKISLLTLCVFSSLSYADPSAIEQRLNELEARLKTLEKQIESKEQKIEKLEQQIEVQEAEKAPTVTYEEDEDINLDFDHRPSHTFKTPERSIRLSGTDTRLLIGGQIWLDAIYNDGEMTNRAGFQPASISFTEDTVDDHTLFNVGQSKLYFKSFTPTKYGDMKTIFEMDMFQTDGNASPQVTQIWAELGDFGAGRGFSSFMDIDAFPNTLEYWGPNAMVFTRQPLLRYTMRLSENDKFAVSIERSNSDFAKPAGFTPVDYDEVNELPDIGAYYYKSGDFGHFKSSLILRRLGYETATKSDETIGWGINLSGSYKLSQKNALTYQVVYGEGIGRYINDTCCNYYADETGGSDAGLDGNGNLTAITATGGFVYFDHHWSEETSSTVGVSYLQVDNLSTQVDKAFKNSLYSTANFIWLPTEMTKVGVELQYGEIENKVGDTGDNFRIQTSFGFKY